MYSAINHQPMTSRPHGEIDAVQCLQYQCIPKNRERNATTSYSNFDFQGKRLNDDQHLGYAINNCTTSDNIRMSQSCSEKYAVPCQRNAGGNRTYNVMQKLYENQYRPLQIQRGPQESGINQYQAKRVSFSENDRTAKFCKVNEPQVKRKVPQVLNKASNKDTPNGQKPDLSMKFVTLNVKDFKIFKEKANYLFLVELFGKLDSAVSLKTLNRHEFIISDNKSDKVACYFYAIDRELPRLIRGQWQRCVGKVDKNGCYHCLSIRPATATELKNMNKLLAIKCDDGSKLKK